MKPKNTIMCPSCRRAKMQFESESKAKNFIKFNKDDIDNGDKLRPYYCDACACWHISSKPYRRVYETFTDNLITAYNKQKNYKTHNKVFLSTRDEIIAKIETETSDFKSAYRYITKNYETMKVLYPGYYKELREVLVSYFKKKYNITEKIHILKTNGLL